MALSTIDLPGGIILSYVAKTGTYTVGQFDSTIDCTANSFTVILPTAVGIAGRTYVVKNSGTGIITVDAAGSETIDGLTNILLISKQSITVQSNGANWIINVSNLPYLQGTWTPVITLVGGAGNVVPVYSTNSGTYTQIGREVFFCMLFSGDGGAEGAGTGQIHVTLPFSTSAEQLAVGPVLGAAINGADEELLSLQFQPSAATFAVFKGSTELLMFTRADQNNTSRHFSLSGSFLV